MYLKYMHQSQSNAPASTTNRLYCGRYPGLFNTALGGFPSYSPFLHVPSSMTGLAIPSYGMQGSVCSVGWFSMAMLNGGPAVPSIAPMGSVGTVRSLASGMPNGGPVSLDTPESRP